MNKVNLKIYHPAHLDLFTLGEGQQDINILKLNTSITCSKKDEAYTVLIDNVPIFAIGARIIREGVAECWIIRSNKMEQYKKFIVETTEKLIQSFSKDNNIRRWQTLINPQFVKWIEFMGFEKESEMIGFDKELQYFMYRRLM